MVNQTNAIMAYKKIKELNAIKLPAVVSFRLYKLGKQLDEYYQWQSEQEKELFAEYNASFTEDGNLTVEDKEKLPEFAEKLNAVLTLQHDDFEKIELPIGAFEMLSMEDIDVLSNVIDFIE